MQRTWFLIIFLLPAVVAAQFPASIYGDGKLLERGEFSDSLAFSASVNSYLHQWVEQGYFFAGLDSVVFAGEAQAFLHRGEAYKLNSVDLRPRRIQSQIQKKIKEYANHGYPFAAVQVDSLSLSGKELTARLVVETGPEIRYDSAYFFKEVKTSHNYMYQLLDIVPGELFREDSYRSIQKKIQRSNFLDLGRPPDLSFRNNKAITFLDVQENPSGSFEGVLGLQQVEGGQTSAVGSLDLSLENLFRSGKELQLFWERFSEQSQRLAISYKHPFLLDSRISPIIQFDLLKQDTSFLTRTTGLGLYTFIGTTTELLLAYEGVKGTLLTTDLELVRRSDFADFTRRLYTVQVEHGSDANLRRLENSFALKGHLSIGRKQVDRNLNLPGGFYDTLALSSDFYRFEAMISYQRKILKRQSIFQEVTFGWIENDEILANELYRIGGLNSLRGFNEKQLFAQQYLLSRVEFRSFFERASYFFLFYDQLIYNRQDIRDFPFGFGFGFALNTSSGQFTFAMAGGKSDEQSLSFSSLKAHFGYIARF